MCSTCGANATSDACCSAPIGMPTEYSSRPISRKIGSVPACSVGMSDVSTFGSFPGVCGATTMISVSLRLRR